MPLTLTSFQVHVLRNGQTLYQQDYARRDLFLSPVPGEEVGLASIRDDRDQSGSFARYGRGRNGLGHPIRAWYNVSTEGREVRRAV